MARGSHPRRRHLERQLGQTLGKPSRLLRHWRFYCENSRLPRKRKVVKDARLRIMLVAGSGIQGHQSGDYGSNTTM